MLFNKKYDIFIVEYWVGDSMIIYIFHKHFYTTFRLPKTVEGNYLLFDYDDNGQKRNLININAKENNWVAISDFDAKIYEISNQENKSNNTDLILSPYKFYNIIINGVEKILLYTCPIYDPGYSFNKMNIKGKVTFGSSTKNDVVLLAPFVSEHHFEISKTKENYHLKVIDKNAIVYVNKISVTETSLSSFDIIFIMGIKLILVGDFLLINFPKQLGVMQTSIFTDNTFSLSVDNYDTTNKLYKNFYDNKDYFSKSPILQSHPDQMRVVFAPPPDISDKSSEKSSAVIDVVPSVLMSLTSLLSTYYTVKNYNSGKTDKESLYTSLLMCAVMLLGSVAWPFINSIIQGIRHKVHFKKIKWKYTRYLKTKEKELKQLTSKQRMLVITRNLSVFECYEIVKHKTSYLYNRHINSSDFLSIRLGVGAKKFDCEFQYEKPEFSMEDLSLYKSIDKLIEKYRYLEDTPISFSLSKNKSLSLITNDDCKYDYLYSILFQVLVLHGYDELKIVILTDERGSNKLNIFKNTNHIWNHEHDIRLFVDDFNTSQRVIDYLDGVYNGRQTSKKIDTHYLIITDCISLYKSSPFINKILTGESNLGFSLLIFDDDINNAPSECDFFVNYTRNDATLFNKDMEELYTTKFKPEFLYNDKDSIDILKAVQELSNIPLKITTTKTANLVSQLGFLEMYGVGNVEQLNSLIKWKNDSIINSLAVPIGVDSFGNLINLDLHEKRHGPHGLIAGMTGSGKSEFIVTYILSLAVSYSPEEVQFVLIDYKGGGLAGAFENRKTGVKLPHLAGTITNLDKSEMNRTLVSIQSELQRRQKKFNEAKEKLNVGTIDIYKYQKLHREGKLDDTISHLFIICDEFAELKAQQPDFMDQLVSAARIGRSLGVHLILATQKPSGVVDDQIWSNAKFKVCCKVQTAEDSNEMIRRPDAAYLTDAGRFYLQVGYDQYFILGQSAYSGTKYIPSEKINTNVDNSIELIDNLGDVVKNIDENVKVETNKDYGEELTGVLNYLIKTASDLNVSSSKLWLDNIPNNIYIDDVKKKYKGQYQIRKNILEPIIGEYDDPAHQSQGLVTLPITTGGNCYICGDLGSGKTTLLSTIIYSTIIAHNTNEVNIYIIDYGAETLKTFNQAPQVGEVITTENADKVNTLINRILNEIKVRKEKLSNMNIDYFSYIKRDDVEPMPNWLVIINGVDSFSESFENLMLYDMPSIIRESNKYGITLIISGSTPNAVGYQLLNQIPQRIALKFTSDENYMGLLDTKLVPSKNPGRGLVKVNDEIYQFQAAQIFKEEVYSNNMEYIFKVLQSNIKKKAMNIPSLPDFIDTKLLSNYVKNIKNIPIGYDISTVIPYTYDFSRYITFILSSSVSTLSKFVNSVLKLMIQCNGVRAIVLNGDNKIKIKSNDKNIKCYDTDFIQLIKFLDNGREKHDPAKKQTMPMIIIGYEEIEAKLKEAKIDDKSIMLLSELIEKSKDSNLYKFIFPTTDCYTSSWEDNDWFSLYNSKNGIILGNDDASQDIMVAKKRNDEYRLELDNTNAYVYNNGNKDIIKYVIN